MTRNRLFQRIVSLGVAAVVVAVGIVLAILSGWMFGDEKGNSQSQGASTAAKPAAEAREAVPVMVQPARTMIFEQRIDVSGNILAKRFALVSARIPGTPDAIFVEKAIMWKLAKANSSRPIR